MAQNQDLIVKLIEKLESLYKKQAGFNSEINDLREELYRLKGDKVETSQLDETVLQGPTSPIEPEPVVETEALHTKNDIVKEAAESKIDAEENNVDFTKPEAVEETIEVQTQPIQKPIQPSFEASKPKPKSKSNLEKFVGENLLNKIGIIITVIGVAIGAKYSIENDLISPLTRIILGYISAIALLGFGIKLKKNYEGYSAVLVSGSIVILYFITFFAYSFYELIPQMLAFVMMVIFTAFTVFTAINYNRQIIAHLGLVGAYAVPFLLSNDSGRVEVLFSYIAIINIGILIISFKKYWKALYYVAFGLTWLIFFSWFAFDYDTQTHFTIGFSFLFIFFITFYLTFLAYKLIRQEAFNAGTIIMLMLNSFIFYGFGYVMLEGHTIGKEFLGVFTLANAVVHFIATFVIYKQKLSDKNLFYLASGMVLIFITLAIPVQLDGNWVTLLWVSEAALLFWIGRTKQVPIYEKISYPLMALAFFSLVQDWDNQYTFYYRSTEESLLPILNINFLSSALFIAAFGFIVYTMNKKSYKSALSKDLQNFVSYAIPTILIFSIYYAFRLEIETYWDQLLANSTLQLDKSSILSNTIRNYDLRDFKRIWVLNYSLFFIAVLAILNFKKLKNRVLKHICAGLAVMAIFTFLFQGLYAHSELRESYLSPSEYYETSIFHLLFRYVSFAFLGLILYTCYKYIKEKKTTKALRIIYDLLLHITIVWVLSSEWLHWMDIFDSNQSYKLGLSILWGVYSFLLIAFGIWKNKQYLRIGGMGLFGITLLKLFLYDIAHLNTISKTILFVSLGVLLLIVSFLYNKYKNQITDEVEK